MRKACRIFRITLLSALLLWHWGFLSAQTQSIENKKAEVNQLNKDIDFLDSQIEATRKKREGTLSEVTLYRKKAQTRKMIVDKLEESIKEQDSLIAERSNQLIETQNKLDTLKEHYTKMVLTAYRNRDSRTWFTYVLASKNIEQGYRRWSYLKNYSKSLNSMAKDIKELQAAVEGEMEQISALKEQNVKDQESKNAEYKKYKKEEEKSQKVANSLAKQQTALKAQLKEKQKQAEKLNKEIEKMIAAALSEKNTTTAPDTPESTNLSSAFEENRGRLPWPVKRGVITEGFGINKHPTLKGVTLPFNNGVNISAPTGCPIYAVFDGVVKQIILIPGYSNCILVQHGQYFTFYCKLGKASVKSGQKVTTGQVLGYLDASGESSELHFELWNGTTKQDPETWLKKY